MNADAQHPFGFVCLRKFVCYIFPTRFCLRWCKIVCASRELVGVDAKHFINKCDLYGAACVPSSSMIETEPETDRERNRNGEWTRASTPKMVHLYCCRFGMSFTWFSRSPLLHSGFSTHSQNILNISLRALRVTTHTCQGFIVIVCRTNSCIRRSSLLFMA